MGVQGGQIGPKPNQILEGMIIAAESLTQELSAEPRLVLRPDTPRRDQLHLAH